MASIRKQTVTFTLGGGKAASSLEFWEFLQKKYDVKLEELMMVQQETSGRKIYVKFVKMERAEQVATESKVRMQLRDGECDVFVQGPEQGVKVVRVRNLPMEVCSEEIVLCLNQYGKVFDVKDERYPRGSCLGGLLTGTRVVRMIVQRNVPSYVRIGGIEAMIFYQGQKATCQVCGEIDHFRVNCPNRRRPPSWADRAAGRKGEQERDVTGNGGGPSPSPAPSVVGSEPKTPPRRASMPELRDDGDVEEFWSTPLQTTRVEQGVSTPRRATPPATPAASQQGVAPAAQPSSSDAPQQEQAAGEPEQQGLVEQEDEQRSRASTFEFVTFSNAASDEEDDTSSQRTLRSRTASIGTEEKKRKRATDKLESSLYGMADRIRKQVEKGHVARTKSTLEKKAKLDKGKGGAKPKDGC